MHLHCGLDFEDSEAIISHDTLAHADASQYQVWGQTVQHLKHLVWTIFIDIF